MSNIFHALKKLYKIPLDKMASNLHYHQSNIYILQDKFDLLEKEFPSIYQSLLSCSHNKDKRTYKEYAQDLVSSWIFEDTLLSHLSKAKLDVILNGADKERIILSHTKIATTSDYLVRKQKKERFVELINSYTSYWVNSKKIDLRDNKYLKMEAKNVLLLCIDVYSNTFYIVDINKNCQATYIPYHHAYGKPAYSIDITKLTPYRLSLIALVQELENKIELS